MATINVWLDYEGRDLRVRGGAGAVPADVDDATAASWQTAIDNYASALVLAVYPLNWSAISAAYEAAQTQIARVRNAAQGL
jgi:hypothetical protein